MHKRSLKHEAFTRITAIEGKDKSYTGGWRQRGGWEAEGH